MHYNDDISFLLCDGPDATYRPDIDCNDTMSEIICCECPITPIDQVIGGAIKCELDFADCTDDFVDFD